MKYSFLIIIGFLVCITTGCDTNYIPKPRAYFRIQFPEKEFTGFRSSCPYTFEYPVYTTLKPNLKGDELLCWMDVHYLPFNADIHLTYKPIIEPDDLKFLLRDAYTFVEKHNQMAEQITEEVVKTPAGGGLIYRIGGNTASSLQFFITDSTQHFLRGSLDFNTRPNKDSLAPLVDYIDFDMRHLIKTLQWKTQEVNIEI